MTSFWTIESFLLLHTHVFWKTAEQRLNMSALNLSDGAGVSSPGEKDLWPSTRFTQETEEKNFLGLAYGGERQEQF